MSQVCLFVPLWLSVCGSRHFFQRGSRPRALRARGRDDDKGFPLQSLRLCRGKRTARPEQAGFVISGGHYHVISPPVPQGTGGKKSRTNEPNSPGTTPAHRRGMKIPLLRKECFGRRAAPAEAHFLICHSRALRAREWHAFVPLWLVRDRRPAALLFGISYR